MSAEPAAAETMPDQPWRGMTLTALLRSSARVKPAGLAFSEIGDPARPLSEWLDHSCVGLAMDGLRLRLTGLGAGPGDTVAIAMPNRAEAPIAILGLLEAGIRPFLLPLSLPPEAFWVGLAAAGACGLLVCGDGPGADLTPDLVLAARAQRALRFVAAFGERAPPGSVPLGTLSEVETLGHVTDPADRHGGADIAVLTLEMLGGIRPIAHRQEALIAGALHLGLTAGIMAGDPILSTVAPATQAGLIAGLVTALVTGSPLAAMPVFSGGALGQALAALGPCHLIVPALLEQPLAFERLLGSDRLRSTLLLHRAPADLTRPAMPAGAASPIIDLLALGERVALAATRESSGRPTLAVGAFQLEELPRAGPIAMLDADARGVPLVSGPALGRPLRDASDAPARIAGLTLALAQDGRIDALMPAEAEQIVQSDPRREASSVVS